MPKFAGRNERRTESYDWMGGNRDSFSTASMNAAQAAIAKHAGKTE